MIRPSEQEQLRAFLLTDANGHAGQLTSGLKTANWQTVLFASNQAFLG
jgi:hypothetical protein